MDEVLAVGDYMFQEKCKNRINEMLEKGTTLLFVSHNMEQVKEICKSAVLLSHGNMIMHADVDSVFEKYQEILC